jgi:hypothetical protein
MYEIDGWYKSTNSPHLHIYFRNQKPLLYLNSDLHLNVLHKQKLLPLSKEVYERIKEFSTTNVSSIIIADNKIGDKEVRLWNQSMTGRWISHYSPFELVFADEVLKPVFTNDWLELL